MNNPTIQEDEIQLKKLQAIRTSRNPDAKDIFKHKDKELAFEKRYGKKVNMVFSYDTYSGGTFSEYTIQVETPNRCHYSLTECLKDDVTDYVLLCYYENRKHEHKYKRFIDAEVALADLIAEELDGDIN